MTLVSTLGLRGNPFEHYTAETEPDIASYAVRPPYLQAISDRVLGLTSFILFGDRGSGKSATRITVYGEIWKRIAASPAERNPFVVNLTDYSALQTALRKDRLTEQDLVRTVAFFVVEQTLVWLASLEEEERKVFVETLDKDERTLAFAIIQGFYLSVGEMDRAITTGEALKLLNSAWTTKSALWVGRRWEALSKILAGAVATLSRKTFDESLDISAPAEQILRSLVGDSPNISRAILSKLAEFVYIFGFSGVVILVDKVDETPATANSAESTTKLVFPLLSHIQLLEVSGFSWVLFLWSKVRDHFNGDKYNVRLDKLAHANITWTAESLRDMLEARISFFSGSKMKFADIFEEDVDVAASLRSIVSIATNSPRELIKLMDTIFREHDARGDSAPLRIDMKSLEIGQDKYVVETIAGFFAEKPLQQVLRLGRTTFVNRDVQAAFKIRDQSARVKIRNWEDAGIVRQSGVQAPTVELGGQPAYRFVVSDPRVVRIIERKLIDTVGETVGEEEEEEESEE